MKPSLATSCLIEAITCDGAMGTELIARGMNPSECGMRWNMDRSEDILAVHRAYRAAGCRMITSNSFGGTRSMLDRHGLAVHTIEWNRHAASLAAEVAGADGWAIGDVGPFGDFLDPLGDTTAAELEGIFREQITALVEGGADAILVETMSDPAEAVAGVRAAKAVCSLPVIATFTFQKSHGGFYTMMGASLSAAIEAVYEAGADIAGANCGTALSLDDYQVLGSALVELAAGRATIIQPNAGAPRVTADGFTYDATPADMAGLARRLRDSGISVVGGCCGTTPAHLAAMVSA